MKQSIRRVMQDWYLVADIGGTNARFGLVGRGSGEIISIARYNVAEHEFLSDAIDHFLQHVSDLSLWQPLPTAACLALACPVEGDVMQFTNSPWRVDRYNVNAQLGGAPIDIINDFAAVGYAVSDLHTTDWQQLGGGAGLANAPIVVLGPGTGLGVCSLVPVGQGFTVVPGEGGHVDFAPIDAQEIAVHKILQARFGRVSAERLLSGVGIMNIYQSLAQLAGKPPLHSKPEDIHDAALVGIESLAVKSLELFCRVLGSFAGNLALTLGAKGGVYFAGGIAPKLLPFLESTEFRHRFDAKGRFRSYLSDVPVRVVTKDDLGVLGAANKILQNKG